VESLERLKQPERAINLREKVAYLSRPESYPEKPAAVAVVQTHMSVVFLTERHAWKLKKPVRYDFLDFSTLDARHTDCEEELRLNRRPGGLRATRIWKSCPSRSVPRARCGLPATGRSWIGWSRCAGFRRT
jgi:hypothetical protein